MVSAFVNFARRLRARPIRTVAALGIIALAVVGLSYAEAQQRPSGLADIRPLPPEFYPVFDCRGEVALLTYYWDRLPQRPGGGRPDPAVLRPLTQAFQGGNIQECHVRVIEVRRYLGLL